MEEKRITFEVVGYTPLLMHNAEAMESSGKMKSSTAKIPLPHDEARKGLYVLPGGQLYIPLIAFLRASIQGGTKFKIGKRTLAQSLAAGVLTDEGICPLVDPKNDKPITAADFDDWPVVRAGSPQAQKGLPDRFIDDRRAVVKATKGAVRRCRPRLQTWKTFVTFTVDPEVLPDADSLLRALEEAGRFVGVLDYRPSTRGPFGRFTAKLVEEKKKK